MSHWPNRTYMTVPPFAASGLSLVESALHVEQPLISDPWAQHFLQRPEILAVA